MSLWEQRPQEEGELVFTEHLCTLSGLRPFEHDFINSKHPDSRTNLPKLEPGSFVGKLCDLSLGA